ncbi:MAG: 4-hydroxy-tetrahydrodipicolinate synthase [Holosporales bacterium]
MLNAHGSYTALVTPFTEAGAVDWKAFEHLLERQIAHGTHGVIPVGTTGESPTLSMEEHKEVIHQTVALANGRVKVLAGTGSNSTAEAIELTLYAEDAGADGALLVTPYYNKPTQEGLFQHFSAIHKATQLPLMLYDVPGRTVTRLSDDLIRRLHKEFPRFFGLKDATGDLNRPLALRQSMPAAFRLFSGEDGTVLPFYIQGGDGCISVVSNVAPSLCRDLYDAASSGHWAEAQRLNGLLFPLAQALFLETSPAPVKYALLRLKLCHETLRLPLVPCGATTRAAVDGALAHAGLL